MNCFTKMANICLLFKGAYTHERKVKISGPTRKAGRGLPSCVLQQEVHGKEELRMVRGTVKGAVMEGDNDMPGLVAVSYYNQKKPVHFYLQFAKKSGGLNCRGKFTAMKHNQW